MELVIYLIPTKKKKEKKRRWIFLSSCKSMEYEGKLWKK